MQFFEQALSFLMNGIYGVVHSYGIAIILFTLASKIILLPVTLWTYFNSIKMIKIQPDINFLKAKYYGQGDVLAEEQNKLYKEQGYHPLLSTIPLFVQIILLMGVVEVIKAGIRNPAIDMNFGPLNLSMVPSENGLNLLWSPFVAGFSSWLLCVVQNRSNVLQAEQSKTNKFGTMAFSVGLSLYLGWFVPVGTCLYWVFSNLFTIAQLYITNAIVRPRRFVDYDRLEQSRKELAELETVGKSKKRESYFSENRVRERKDYKRFFSVNNKHLVFYSESSGFYKYFRGVVEYLLVNTNITIHYITSDPNDQIFELEKQHPQLKGYYIGENKLITLMMKMDADIVVMTMPDLENYHIKRSYVRKDIEYIFIPHSMCSLNLTMRTASIDHFDTIFCTGKHQREETEKTEIAYNLPKKTLVDWGYCLLDDMRARYVPQERKPGERRSILIAPSWQKDNIVDSCLDELLESLSHKDYQITVRPHPQHVRHQPERMEQLKQRFAGNENIEIQTDFSSDATVFQADMMITDWSGIAYEYAFTTYKPVVFIDTPVKIMNPEYTRIDTEPFNIWMRDILGKVVRPEDAGQISGVIDDIFAHEGEYHDVIRQYANDYVYNLDHSGEVGAKYIIDRLLQLIREKKEKAKK